MPDGPRIACINPRCRRTFKDDGTFSEIICGKCFKALPADLRSEHRRCWRELRKWRKRIARTSDAFKLAGLHRLERIWVSHLNQNWRLIREATIQPEKPAGLEGFLEELGLK